MCVKNNRFVDEAGAPTESAVVGPGLTLNFFFFKSAQNSPKPVLIFWSSIHGRRSVGDGGDASPPLFSLVGTT